MGDRLLTPEQAAEILSIAPRTVREWLRSGKLPGVKVSTLWRVRESDLQQFIKDMPAVEPKTGD